MDICINLQYLLVCVIHVVYNYNIVHVCVDEICMCVKNIIEKSLQV